MIAHCAGTAPGTRPSSNTVSTIKSLPKSLNRQLRYYLVNDSHFCCTRPSVEKSVTALRNYSTQCKPSPDPAPASLATAAFNCGQIKLAVRWFAKRVCVEPDRFEATQNPGLATPNSKIWRAFPRPSSVSRGQPPCALKTIGLRRTTDRYAPVAAIFSPTKMGGFSSATLVLHDLLVRPDEFLEVYQEFFKVNTVNIGTSTDSIDGRTATPQKTDAVNLGL